MSANLVNMCVRQHQACTYGNENKSIILLRHQASNNTHGLMRPAEMEGPESKLCEVRYVIWYFRVNNFDFLSDAARLNKTEKCLATLSSLHYKSSTSSLAQISVSL